MGCPPRNPQGVGGCGVSSVWAYCWSPPMKLPWIFKFLVLGKGGWKRSVQSNFFVEMFLAKSSQLTDEQLAPYRTPYPTPDDRVGIARFPQLIPQTRAQLHKAWPTTASI